MYYSAIGLLAILILIIENQDILFRRSDGFQLSARGVYRRFLFAVLAYYVTDVLWGLLESRKLAALLFADTTVYFIAMAVGVQFWAQYTVAYLEERTAAGRCLKYAGRAIAGLISVIAVANVFAPVLFTVDAACVYHALPIRYGMLVSQIVLLLLISAYAVSSIHRHPPEKRQRCRTLAAFGLIMAVFLFVQLWYPYLPLYSMAYMFGTCLLHTFVVNDEKEEYRRRLEEACASARSTGTIFTHIALSLARGYTDLYYVNMDTDEFIEYQTEEDRKVLSEVRRGADFFEGCERDAKKYVYQDDQAAFVRAMNRDFLTNALSRSRVYELIYRRIKGGAPFYVRMKVTRMEDDDRFIVIAVTNIDEQMKQRLAEKRMKEERVIYARLHALTGNFICVYVVEPDTGHYREFTATADYDPSFAQAKDGADFFNTLRDAAKVYSHPDDTRRVLSLLTQENVMAEIAHSGIYTLGYRIMMDGRPVHVQLKAAMVEEEEGPRLIVGLNDIDTQVRQEEEYERRLAQAQTQANIDALTGIKNKHAYLEVETRMDRQIAEHRQPPFAIAMLDVNDLKKINDTEGHQAGDQYLRSACKIICDIFKHSPVFRVGGDEFAVISQNSDYDRIEELLREVSVHNALAIRDGGVVIACGMARFNGDPCVAAVFERADQNMYENKTRLKAAKGEKIA